MKRIENMTSKLREMSFDVTRDQVADIDMVFRGMEKAETYLVVEEDHVFFSAENDFRIFDALSNVMINECGPAGRKLNCLSLSLAAVAVAVSDDPEAVLRILGEQAKEMRAQMADGKAGKETRMS